MKVIYISLYEFAPVARSATRPTDMIRHLPCEVVECYTKEMIYNHIGDTDVVLVNRQAALPGEGRQWMPVIKESDALVGLFITDVWHSLNVISDLSNLMGVNIYLAAYRTCTEIHAPDMAKMSYWCPASTDARNCYIPRDIDVLYWGIHNGHPEYYPFRRVVLTQLNDWIVAKNRRIDRSLTIYEIEVAGYKYKYAQLESMGMAYSWHRLIEGDVLAKMKNLSNSLAFGHYETKLYRLLSRARIVCTGPGMDAPVGKFFENAACGAVTVTSDFTDREDLGFEHGVNIWITNEDSFEKDLCYLLGNPELVAEMSRNAEELIRTRHSRMVRAQALYKFLCEKTGKI